uniref:Uncharacterized protein n=1 Tax=viral metagenome TaxID=1070528 RepID=A0A2V0RAQ0_9ZZZZ
MSGFEVSARRSHKQFMQPVRSGVGMIFLARMRKSNLDLNGLNMQKKTASQQWLSYDDLDALCTEVGFTRTEAVLYIERMSGMPVYKLTTPDTDGQAGRGFERFCDIDDYKITTDWDHSDLDVKIDVDLVFDDLKIWPTGENWYVPPADYAPYVSKDNWDRIQVLTILDIAENNPGARLFFNCDTTVINSLLVEMQDPDCSLEHIHLWKVPKSVIAENMARRVEDQAGGGAVNQSVEVDASMAQMYASSPLYVDDGGELLSEMAHFKLSIIEDPHLSLPCSLTIGPPGCGKSYFVKLGSSHAEGSSGLDYLSEYLAQVTRSMQQDPRDHGFPSLPRITGSSVSPVEVVTATSIVHHLGASGSGPTHRMRPIPLCANSLLSTRFGVGLARLKSMAAGQYLKIGNEVVPSTRICYIMGKRLVFPTSRMGFARHGFPDVHGMVSLNRVPLAQVSCEKFDFAYTFERREAGRSGYESVLSALDPILVDHWCATVDMNPRRRAYFAIVPESTIHYNGFENVHIAVAAMQGIGRRIDDMAEALRGMEQGGVYASGHTLAAVLTPFPIFLTYLQTLMLNYLYLLSGYHPGPFEPGSGLYHDLDEHYEAYRVLSSYLERDEIPQWVAARCEVLLQVLDFLRPIPPGSWVDRPGPFL